jgi:hypothetical protein
MPGMQIGTGLRFRASTADTAGSSNTGTVDYAAFSPGSTQAPQTRAQALHPGTPQGLTFWVGVASLAALALIRHSLPK